MRLGEGKVIDKDTPDEISAIEETDTKAKSGTDDRPIYGANLLEEAGRKVKSEEKSGTIGSNPKARMIWSEWWHEENKQRGFLD